MRTRRGNAYPDAGAQASSSRKRAKIPSVPYDQFDKLSDDLVISILTRVSSAATCPADFIASLLTCRRLNCLGLDPFVLSNASPEIFAVKAKTWSESTNRFLHRSSDAGNIEASYTLGMIQFYCFHNWRHGAALMAKAAIKSHAQALYSLAIIQFNGSGGTKNVKDLMGGVTLCARAAFLGNIEALRELGHCFRDGYGIGKNVVEGQRFLVEANAREMTAYYKNKQLHGVISFRCTPALLNSDFGFEKPKIHPANRFLTGWYESRIPHPVLQMCSYAGCGRPETRMHEFRRCSACGVVNYCSRGCQARDWTQGHMRSCRAMPRMFRIPEFLHP